ncbi:TIGR04283 family arsenosugar biosynthesis glycosyltransferase [Magnetospira sp. QH-2]|uniref:TIGR04283 family arsenosugar biosynthesis glycosyltransferase n=1 Tax=Magnetospira sp. (strain QH-2) TaxID=1288970 RepID=UPI0003E8160B|nr:TIGR04283 family arsenosugar biosynthesis glycosyltransferase [Magnetospira sp. QH-2]CCQ75331.1 Putative GT2 [Magnetospira sp. QH-2]
MLSIVIPTLNAAARLPDCLKALSEPPMEAEIIVADGGSVDGTPVLAKRLGALVIKGPVGRGPQLAEGARQAHGQWLLFLHGDTVLAPEWKQAVTDFIADPLNRERAGYFRFKLDDDNGAARRMEKMVAWRCETFNLPYGDQGLLVSRSYYDKIGGYARIPLMEDVDILKRIGLVRLQELQADAVTSADRYRRDGYVLRPLRNLSLLALYLLGMEPEQLVKYYG